ncbi:citrate lyase subunit gamma, partial [Sedimentibacter sp.]|uniref:citrate lyase subunit gamma n=1 Tax=Sedimentibacter sp. TaxID=1960295 RepID=UPI0028B0C549
ELHLESIVYNQFSEEIETTVRDVLNDFSVENIKIQLKDRGAVECAIRARVETALKRAGGVNS